MTARGVGGAAIRDSIMIIGMVTIQAGNLIQSSFLSSLLFFFFSFLFFFFFDASVRLRVFLAKFGSLLVVVPCQKFRLRQSIF